MQVELKTSLLHPQSCMKHLKPCPSLVDGMGVRAHIKPRAGSLSPPLGNSHRSTAARSCAKFLRAAYELVVRPTPPAVSLVLPVEPGERTTSMLQYQILLMLNSALPEAVLSDGFL